MRASSGSPARRRRLESFLRAGAPTRGWAQVRTTLAAAAACNAFALAAPAFAQQPAEASEPAPAPPSAPLSPPLSPQPSVAADDARQLLDEAKRLYASERYAEALDMFERVYALEPNPAVLFNIGAVHAALHQCELARDAYRRYIDSTRSESGRTDAREQLERLNECDTSPDAAGAASTPSEPALPPEAPAAVSSAATAALPETPPPAPSVPALDFPPPMATDSAPNAMQVAGWIAIGTGGVLGVASLGFAYASSRADDADRRAAPGQSGDEAAREQRAGERYNALAWGLAGGAVAVAGSGLLLLWLQPDEQTSVQVASTAGGLGLSLERHF